MRLALSCLAFVLVGGAVVARAQEAGPGPRPEPQAHTLPHVDRFLDAVDAPLVSYRAIRRLEAASRNGKMKASLSARTTLDPERGFRFEILEETGSGVIRSKVLRAALEAERRAHNSREIGRGALSRTNYEFGPPEAAELGFVRVGIKPRRSDTMLVVGSILLTDDHADLVSIEGRLVKRPSFWTRRVDVVRRYARIAGVRVPVSMESKAEVLIAGRSTFSMHYEYEAINEVVGLEVSRR